MEVVYARQALPESEAQRLRGGAIFLAGPTPRTKEVASWRPATVRLLLKKKFSGYVFLPEDPGGGTHGDKALQRKWEWRALEAADAVLFWVPRNLKTLPGFTTNIEFGYWAARAPGKVVFGAPSGAPQTSYMRELCTQPDVRIPVCSSLTDVVERAIARTKRTS